MPAPTTPIDEAKLQKYVNYILFEGGCLADIRGITSDELEAVYAIAYTEYGQRHFAKAENLFKFLCLFDHRQQKHWMGLAATRQQLGNFKDAVMAYVMAGSLNRQDPLPPLQLAECLLSMDELDKAESALELALHAASQDPRFAKAKDRAQALMKAVQTRRTKKTHGPSDQASASAGH